MIPRNLRNIHITGNSSRETLSCTSMALNLPRYFCLLMEKPLGRYFQVWSPYYQVAQCYQKIPIPVSSRWRYLSFWFFLVFYYLLALIFKLISTWTILNFGSQFKSIFRTLSNIQDGVFCKIVDDFKFLTIFAKTSSRCLARIWVFL